MGLNRRGGVSEGGFNRRNTVNKTSRKKKRKELTKNYHELSRVGG